MSKSCDKCPWTTKGKPDIGREQTVALLNGEWFCCHVNCGTCHGAKNLKDSLEGYIENKVANKPADGVRVKVFTDKGNFYTGIHYHLLGGSMWESDSFTDDNEHVIAFKLIEE